MHEKLDHWFRHEYGRVLSILIARFGPAKIDLIEDSIHDAMLKAMLVWGYQHVPDNPSAWIYRVSSRNLIDELRRKHPQQEVAKGHEDSTEPDLGEISDETLKLIFACCHPLLSEEESIVLCLKFAAGFGLHEISRALFISYEATKKKFQRAKARFKAGSLGLELPENAGLQNRVDGVLKVIFLIFTEGYRPTSGDLILKEDLCYEALRIALQLNTHDDLQSSKLHALIALMCFKSARIEARMRGEDGFIRLKDQDRSLWSKELLAEGNHFLSLAFKEDNQSEYHFHAAVESQYITAPSFEKTNWEGLLNIYNYWRKVTKNPSLELNRVVVVMHALGPDKAIKELNENCTKKDHLYHAIKGEILVQLGERETAIKHLQEAIKLNRNNAEIALLEKKIHEIEQKKSA